MGTAAICNGTAGRFRAGVVGRKFHRPEEGRMS